MAICASVTTKNGLEWWHVSSLLLAPAVNALKRSSRDAGAGMSMALGLWTLPAFLVTFFGYIVFSSVLQYLFYYCRADSATSWKVQPSQRNGLGDSRWWLPAFRSRLASKETHPLHRLFATINIFTASSFAGLTAELTSRGTGSRLHNSVDPDYIYEAGLLLAALALQSVLEYIWHLVMHSRWCYARLHKYHHHYRSPGPFDDMFIHPLEAMGYYFILYSPAYVLRLHVQTFLVYMALLGTFGVLDHSGIRFSIPGLYATEDHDRHHSHFEVNYAFPFPYLDLLCGTYSGTFLGRHYCDTKALERVRRRQQGGKGGGGKPGTEGIAQDRSQKGLIKEQ